ncbi:sema domain immunoglobulin domain (Ig) transmembrane domain (TM) and short cytoplasmic domain (semaphorin) 4G [Cricetulus griseus]
MFPWIWVMSSDVRRDRRRACPRAAAVDTESCDSGPSCLWGPVGLNLPRKMWGRLWPLLFSFLTVTAVPGPSLRRPSRELDATPRTTISYGELSQIRHFKGQAQNYSTLLLEDASERLLVGARGALFSLSARDIGDGAHKQDLPFMHVMFPIVHDMCLLPQMEDSTQLHDAEFVFSVLVRESKASAVGDDDKIYYFFMEREEGSSSFTQSRSSHRVARVARVCKGDLGGKKILQKKWTSFLKARLICHIPQYETLRGVCSLDADTSAHTHFYAVFTLTTQWKTLEASAICRYDLAEMQAVFTGPFMEYQDGARRWGRYEGGVPEPRPGSCITDSLRSRGYNSSQDLPSPVLDFVKLHPLMARPVVPTRGRPLLLKRNVRYTHLTGTHVSTPAGPTYDLLFLGTADGWIHKAVVLSSGMHIIEEMQVFREPQSVDNLVISPMQHSLYVGAASGVIQFPLSSCSRYRSCYDCILARDPYCGWDSSTHACMVATTIANRTALIQDVERGNRGCEGSRGMGPPPPLKTRSVLRGDDVLLPCDQPSNLARALWLLNGSKSLSDGQDGYRVGVDGLLVTDTQLEHSGNYGCYAEENGLRMLLASYSLTVRPATPAPAPQAPAMPGAQLARDMRLFYVVAIAILGGLCLILASSLLYVACLKGGRRGRRRKYSLGRAGGSAVQLQTVSGQCPGEEDEEELSRILEKRKHTQLVEQLDESSV